MAVTRKYKEDVPTQEPRIDVSDSSSFWEISSALAEPLPGRLHSTLHVSLVQSSEAQSHCELGLQSPVPTSATRETGTGVQAAYQWLHS